MANSALKRFGKSKGVKRAFGAIMAAALAAGGIAVANSDESGGSTCEPTIVKSNPMGAATPVGSENGYTIFVTEDAIFANSELEGSMAVGGKATFGGPSAPSPQYPIYHNTGAGNSDYGLPTIDGENNRVLLH